MALNLNIPKNNMLKPKIIVFGVGGAGGNAINNMIRSNLEGVEFVAANTDAQALSHSLAPNCIQLGMTITKGLGAGSFPDRGKTAAEENIEEIEKYLEGCHMVFIAAGMGGGTGTGAAPVIAKLARERDVLTVGVVTKPFHFEGKYRMETADSGIDELKKYVDTLIVIPNQNLFRIANEHTTFESAFKMADDVLHAGVRGVTDLITMPGLVNLDFADIKAIMTKMGKAMMGTGEAEGPNRAILACEAAISNPLLDDVSIKGAKGVLVNMTGGPDMTLFEADMAVNSIKKEVDPNANIIFGSAFNESMNGRIRISVVATGIDVEQDALSRQEVGKSARFKMNFAENSVDNNQKKQHSEVSQISSNRSFFDPGISAKPANDKFVEEISDIDFRPKKNYSKEANPNYGKVSDRSSEYAQGGASEGEDKFTQISFFGSELEEKLHSSEAAESNTKKFSSIVARIEDENFAPKSTQEFERNKKPAKAKKDSSGFSLFSFMGGSKDKEEPSTDDLLNRDESDFIRNNNSDSLSKITAFNNPNKQHFHQVQKVEFREEEVRGEVRRESRAEVREEVVTEVKRNDVAEREELQAPVAKKRASESFKAATIFETEDDENLSAQEIEDDILNVPAFFRRKKS